MLVSARSQRLSGLDALRGVAALSVVIFHFVLHQAEKFSPTQTPIFFAAVKEVFEANFDLGKIAVVSFFLISGYVVPFSARGTGMRHAIAFAVGRAFRIFPLFWAVVLTASVVMNLPISHALLNASMTNLLFGVPNIFGLFWTLHVEMVFYALIALLILVGISGRRGVVSFCLMFFTLVSLTGAVVKAQTSIYVPVGILLPFVFLSLGWLLRLDADSTKLADLLLPCGVVLLVWLTILVAYPGEEIKYMLSYFLPLIIFRLAMLGWMTSRFTLFLGKISYGVYLVHPLVFVVLVPPMVGYASAILAMVVAVLVVLVVSTLLHEALERPLMAVSSRLRVALTR